MTPCPPNRGKSNRKSLLKLWILRNDGVERCQERSRTDSLKINRIARSASAGVKRRATERSNGLIARMRTLDSVAIARRIHGEYVFHFSCSGFRIAA
jgi:hypothetical protein